ncbi:fibroleukin isoform X2 [Eurytemora carolleeae]|uniref:fibroleukin isoform X2 n=1 Tax=Eurytemora carolleeae TaxID=1294199 RepID=UPI000C76E6A5|nr:fibroleukin isoform X2 [Eurytemora carolleeae]|eukprot:XP_023342647.1 fibroleukin-like isoform X2 [Eurytemora affinis]
MIRLVFIIIIIDGVTSQYGQIPSDTNSIRLLQQSVSQLHGVSDRLIDVETNVKMILMKLNILDSSINNKDSESSLESSELKRQLDIMFSKMESLDYDISGFGLQLETLKKDLDFMKKGYSGVYDLVSNSVDSRQCGRGGGGGSKDSRQLSSTLQQLQAMLQNFSSTIEALQTRSQDEYDNSANKDDLRYVTYMLESLTTQYRGSLKDSREYHLPRDCTDIGISGIHKIQPDRTSSPIFVYCYADLDGGWTVIQQRNGGYIDFHRKDIDDYRMGFGNVASEYWIGLDRLHFLTAESEDIFELRIEITDFKNKTAVASYSLFAISGRSQGYQITLLGGYSGTAGDSLTASQGENFNIGFPQSAVDQQCNEDEMQEIGGWWFPTSRCPNTGSNLNGRYLAEQESSKSEASGIFWTGFHGAEYSLDRTRMMIRPKKLR